MKVALIQIKIPGEFRGGSVGYRRRAITDMAQATRHHLVKLELPEMALEQSLQAARLQDGNRGAAHPK